MFISTTAPFSIFFFLLYRCLCAFACLWRVWTVFASLLSPVIWRLPAGCGSPCGSYSIGLCVVVGRAFI